MQESNLSGSGERERWKERREITLNNVFSSLRKSLLSARSLFFFLTGLELLFFFVVFKHLKEKKVICFNLLLF